MKRTLIGLVFVAHGLAHSGPGIWASAVGPEWFVVPLWWLAEVGFLVAGFGLLGVPWCRRVWEPSALVAAVASIMMHQRLGSVALAFGLVLDVIIIVVGLRWGESSLLASVSQRPAATVHPRRHRVTSALASALVLWVALVIPLRSWHIRWGTTLAERRATLPGDEVVRQANYRVDHAVTIDAPADSVWPWLAQLGQDRGGFYSYDRLERLIGAEIRNANRVHPEWQVRQPGDLVRATQPGYLGGLFGENPGWRVVGLVPGRALVLEQWGAFVLQPMDSARTRLYVRTRGEGTPNLASTLVAPLGLLMFEPAHFVMQRRMLLGIKERAEHG
ncbi:MAG TPA: hypothetical protein VFN38_09760 [Gemmatimonadaceae bacterium]|nr:hypothetical protein [Gemmatimonadaceae bacterium]